jgi:hypothetical protein
MSFDDGHRLAKPKTLEYVADQDIFTATPSTLATPTLLPRLFAKTFRQDCEVVGVADHES